MTNKRLTNSFLLALAVIMAGAVIAFCNHKRGSEATNLEFDGYRKWGFVDKIAETDFVLINDVLWATHNIGTPCTFTENHEDVGMFYQWNKNTGWSSTDPMVNSNNDTIWDASISAGTHWEEGNDPSPFGYRLPTVDELYSLLDTVNVLHVWTTVNDVQGAKFVDKSNGNMIFLPVPGYRYCDDGRIYEPLYYLYGIYWSCTRCGYDSNFAYCLYFSKEDGLCKHKSRCDNGNTIRCVMDKETFLLKNLTLPPR